MDIGRLPFFFLSTFTSSYDALPWPDILVNCLANVTHACLIHKYTFKNTTINTLWEIHVWWWLPLARHCWSKPKRVGNLNGGWARNTLSKNTLWEIHSWWWPARHCGQLLGKEGWRQPWRGLSHQLVLRASYAPSCSGGKSLDYIPLPTKLRTGLSLDPTKNKYGNFPSQLKMSTD